MIYSIGTDIVEIARVKDAVERWGGKFLKRIFTEGELSYCYEKRNPYPSLAARFAAKEALIKALSISELEADQSKRIIKITTFKNIEILNHPTGKPFINLLGSLKTDMFVIHLTLTHERNYAIATVVLETKSK